MYIKSPLNYIGGKYKLLDNILPIFPKKIDTFVDLFAGGMNVSININANKIIVNDQINYLIELYRYFQENKLNNILKDIENIINKYNLSLENVGGYNRLREDYNKQHNSLYLFVLTCYSFNHQIRFNNNHQFNTPFGKQRSSFNNRIKENLIKFIEKIQSENFCFLSDDFLNFDIDSLNENDFMYCDPPYLITTGSYNDGNRGFKNWTEREDESLMKLLDKLDSKNIKFALSNVFVHKGLTNDKLIEWSKKYNVEYIDNSYSNCNYQFKNKEEKTIEVLVYN